jgi:hypothetical protein
MSLSMAMGIAQGAMSIFGGMAKNAAIEKAATEQYNANKLFIERDQGVLNEQLRFAGEEINNQVGMALTDLLYQFNKAEAQQTAQQAETNIYGNTALRKRAGLAMREALQEDRLIQQGEAQMTDLQTKLTQVKYDTEAKHAQNAQAYNNAMAQKSSTFEILANGVSSGISGYSSGQDILNAQKSATLMDKQIALFG